ncbi:MAG: MarC family protein [Crocosphaera sp.]
MMAYQLISSAMATFMALFPVANPVGVVPIFYSLAGSNSPRIRGRQARQVALNAVIVLGVFFLAGRLILDFFGISLGVLQIAGGLLVGQTAWQMMSTRDLEQSLLSNTENRDISLIPMAIPIVSGPGAIGMAIALATQNQTWWHYLGSLLGIGLLGVILYFCLALGEPLVKLLGKSGLKAFNQVLGFFILAIAIQLIADGILGLVN